MVQSAIPTGTGVMNQAPTQTTPTEQKTDKPPKRGGMANLRARYIGAMILVLVILPIPILAALVAVVIYIAPRTSVERIDPWLLGPNIITLLLTSIITLVVWLVLALFCTSFATAKGGQQLNYDSLKNDLEVLKARSEILEGAGTFASLPKEKRAGLSEDDEARYIALADIAQTLASIDEALQSDGLQWVLGTEYVNVWKQIYHAREAMITLLPSSTLVGDAKYDESRLHASDIPDSVNLLALLQNAITTLSPPPAQTLQPQQTEGQARADIRRVSYVIHKFTSERWEGLIRTRNQLMATALLAGVFPLVLLVITVLANVDPEQIKHAVVFYFLGALVGLFARLATESNQTDSSVDDYGLTMARVLVTPLLSGLAALVGVFLIGLITPSVIAPGSSAFSIANIYNFAAYNLLFAAIFGLLPNRVINVLQQKSEDVKSQIRSSSPADTGMGRGARGTGDGGKNQIATTLNQLSGATNQIYTLTSQMNNLSGQLSSLTGLLNDGTPSIQPGSGMTGMLSGHDTSHTNGDNPTGGNAPSDQTSS